MSNEASKTRAHFEFQRFVSSISSDDRMMILHDFNADGVSAGVILQRSLERVGFTQVVRMIPEREGRLGSPSLEERIHGQSPKALFVLELSNQAQATLPGLPTCWIDHRRPAAPLPGVVQISAEGWEPTPSTSLLIYDLCEDWLLERNQSIEDLDWIAALGVLSERGEKAPFELLSQAKKRHRIQDLIEVTSLLNAVGRSPDDVRDWAASALLTHGSPKALAESNRPEVQAMRKARLNLAKEMSVAKSVIPQFSGSVAWIETHSKYRVHPLVAEIWRSRLPENWVIVSNDRYIPGRVQFVARSSGDSALDDLLRGYAQRHGHYFEGSLPPDQWRHLLEALDLARAPVKSVA